MKRLLILNSDEPTFLDVPDRIFDALRDLSAQPFLDHADLVIKRGPERSFVLERKERDT